MAATYKIGTCTRRSSARASHVRTARSRSAITSGSTEQIAFRSLLTNVGGASGPSRILGAMDRVFTAQHAAGTINEAMTRRARHTGGATNPAQITSPHKPLGADAAERTASGEEKDSPRSTKRPSPLRALLVSASNCPWERLFLPGNRMTSGTTHSGRASTKSENNSPVPSIPGRSTSLMGFLSLSTLRVASCTSRTCYQPLAGSRSGPKLIGMVRRFFALRGL